MHSIESIREKERDELTTLLKKLFAFHERKAGHCFRAIMCGPIPIVKKDQEIYLVYGVNNVLYFASDTIVPFYEEMSEWFPHVLEAAQHEGILPCYQRAYKGKG